MLASGRGRWVVSQKRLIIRLLLEIKCKEILKTNVTLGFLNNFLVFLIRHEVTLKFLQQLLVSNNKKV